MFAIDGVKPPAYTSKAKSGARVGYWCQLDYLVMMIWLKKFHAKLERVFSVGFFYLVVSFFSA